MINPTTAVNPSQESIVALRELPDDDPVVMVNLLKFREPDGRKRYARYAAVSGREIADRGGRVLYSGRSLADSEWDSVALVYYPRRGARLDMQACRKAAPTTPPSPIARRVWRSAVRLQARARPVGRVGPASHGRAQAVGQRDLRRQPAPLPGRRGRAGVLPVWRGGATPDHRLGR